jgi:glycosyltransferase involved in cell wall biosynthesis
MKILCVIDSLGAGGAQRQLVELALGFKEKGHAVFFLTYHNIPYYHPILDRAGIGVTCIDESNYLTRLLSMRRFIRKTDVDAVISFLEAPNIICEAASIPSKPWKLVVGERSADPTLHTSMRLKTYRWLHVLADYVVANSHANMKMIHAINPMLPKTKCRVIYNAVDLSRWKPPVDYRPRKNGKLKLVIASTHRYLKNLDGLLEGLRLLNADERSNLDIEWYGEEIDSSFADAQNKMKDFALENILSFYPATHEITRKIQNADVVCLFSHYEGLPNVVCEGMACSKPVICSAVSDVPDLLSHEPRMLCNSRDPQSITNAIRYVLGLSNSQLRMIGEQNKRCAEEFFGKEKIVAQYLELLT